MKRYRERLFPDWVRDTALLLVLVSLIGLSIYGYALQQGFFWELHT